MFRNRETGRNSRYGSTVKQCRGTNDAIREVGGGGGGVWWVISSQQDFFSPSNLSGSIFFPLLNALEDNFFSPHFSAGFGFPQKKKVSCLHDIAKTLYFSRK